MRGTMNKIESVVKALGIKAVSRKGRRLWCYCPWHEDKVATNFFIRISGKYVGSSYCFVCKKGGGLTWLVMQVRSCSEESAEKFVELLGRGYQAPPRAVAFVNRSHTLGRKRFRMPPECVFSPLASWVSGARQEATRRGITQEEVATFKLGYAVDQRLAGRIIIPWLNSDAKPVGYSARTFVDAEPKYLTPATNEHYDSSVMVGEHLWPNDHRFLVVTEGAINAMCVRRVRPEVAIGAMGGSDINPQQVIKIATFKDVIILTDPDKPGDDAAKKLQKMLGRHVKSIHLRLPDGKDAFDVGPEFLREHLGTVIDLALHGTLAS